MTLILRQLEFFERELVADWLITEGWPGREKTTQIDAAEFDAILNMLGHTSFCMSEPNKPPVGFGQIMVNSADTINLVRIIVDPMLRGRGFGKQLSALLLAEARRLPQAGPVRLRVRRTNHAAVAVYAALGFSIIDSDSNSDVFAMAAHRISRQAC